MTQLYEFLRRSKRSKGSRIERNYKNYDPTLDDDNTLDCGGDGKPMQATLARAVVGEQHGGHTSARDNACTVTDDDQNTTKALQQLDAPGILRKSIFPSDFTHVANLDHAPLTTSFKNARRYDNTLAPEIQQSMRHVRARQPLFRAACDGCFLAKVKCSGARPICSRCLACGIECQYSPSRRKGKSIFEDNKHVQTNDHQTLPQSIYDEFDFKTGRAKLPASSDSDISPDISVSTGLAMLGVTTPTVEGGNLTEPNYMDSLSNDAHFLQSQSPRHHLDQPVQDQASPPSYTQFVTTNIYLAQQQQQLLSVESAAQSFLDMNNNDQSVPQQHVAPDNLNHQQRQLKDLQQSMTFPMPNREDNMSIDPIESQECSVSRNDLLETDSQSNEYRDSSIDSDMLSISDDSDDCELLSLEDRIYLELIILAIDVVGGDTCDTADGQSSTRTRATNSLEYTRASSSFCELGIPRSSRKRGRAQKSTEDSDDDEERPQPPSRRASKSETGDRSRSLACPFVKRDPIKHRNCFSKKLSRIRDVKQHLTRKHTPELYCNRCKVIFPDDASLQEHVGDVAGLFCEPSPWLDGISLAQRQRLSRKSDPRLSVQEQWYSMWDIIFPGHNRPSSVYVIFGFSEDLCSYKEFSTGSRVADSVVEGLRDSGINAPDTTWDDVRRIIADRVDSSFDQWLSNQSTNSITLSDTSSSNLQRTSTQATRQDTPASSESSRVDLGYSDAVDESRNRQRPGAEVPASRRQDVVEDVHQAGQETHESAFDPLQDNNPTLPNFEVSNSGRLNNPFINQGHDLGFNFDVPRNFDTSLDSLCGEPGTGYRATKPNSDKVEVFSAYDFEP